ncbi:MAG TPA: nitroreductase family deazaflavin-dependent oxidoreductase [Ktedonobacteraceae bacterium]|jgi:deazaflavin-dependent oxidoreductase (nitroreductase family)|nr:nitroreductase family deazaflavin-dependent oxidoreductase [Ktedonobacteraceae bacterium]
MALETKERAERQPPQIANQIVALLLRSPMHRLISNTLLLLTFTGRKSGKEYSIPLGYGRQGNTLTLFTDHPWYKNLLARPTVKVRLQGKERTGTAEVILDDKELTAHEILAFVRHHPRAARAYSVTFDAEGQPNQESLRKAAERFVLIRVKLE